MDSRDLKESSTGLGESKKSSSKQQQLSSLTESSPSHNVVKEDFQFTEAHGRHNHKKRTGSTSTSIYNRSTTNQINEGEIDALGILHNDISSDSSVGASDPIIDHRNVRQMEKSHSTDNRFTKRISITSPADFRSSKGSASSSTPARNGSSLKNIYIPTDARNLGRKSVSGHDVYSGMASPSTRTYTNPIFSSAPRTSYVSHAQTRENPYEYMNHRSSQYSTKEFTAYGNGGNLDENSDSEESNSVYASSNPSSRRSSNASSLDDVCFPVDSIDEEGARKIWPDVKILEQFAEEEREMEKKIKENAYQLNRRTSTYSDVSPGEENVGFRYPLVSNIEESSDSEPLISSDSSRPNVYSSTTGWQSENRFHILSDKKVDSTKARFTYFREDLSSTIHSNTLSGLLNNDECKTFTDLFVPSEPSSTEVEELQLNTSSLINAVNAPTSSLQNLARLKSPSVTQSNTASVKSMNNSTIYSTVNELNPFWLDVLDPSEDELKTISKAFGVHPLTTEDIFLGETREKVELFKDYYFLCFTSFDIVQARYARKRELEKNMANSNFSDGENGEGWISKTLNKFFNLKSKSEMSNQNRKYNQSLTSKRKKSTKADLEPLNMYIIVFRDGVITFHFKPTPHPTNVRRRARLLRDYLTVSSDWIGYALIDDVTDAFAPMIDSIEMEVNSIENAILLMQSGKDSDDESDSDSEDEDDDKGFVLRMKRRGSGLVPLDKRSLRSSSSKSTSSSSSTNTKIISWKRKGDMLRRIGACRKKVMSILRLLSFKADVIKGFAKRCNEQWDTTPKSEIAMYLSDIQDHIITMVQALNHYEKLLARSHSNYLAQINIDMTKVNNEMNDVLGKITILGTIVLPLNIVTGLWGMNCIVPGQSAEGLTWFYGISGFMFLFAVIAYFFAKKVSGI